MRQVEYTVFRDKDGNFMSADLINGGDYCQSERIPETDVSMHSCCCGYLFSIRFLQAFVLIPLVKTS